VLRSLLALKLLQFSLSGAMAAAATTSLPETLGGSRNWDYRFCWLRDASFVLRAFVDIGYWREGQAFFDWLMHSTRLSHPRLQPLYTLFGRRRAPERTLAQFTGYCGSRPVRIGNAAATQFQLDAYGGLIGAARDFVARGHELDSREESLLVQVGRMVCRHWREPDNGIWEFRGARHHHTYSKARAWAGLDDLVWLADHHGLNAPRVLFQAERDAIKDEIMNKGVHEGQARFKGAFDTDYIDAALLLLPRLHFIEPSHPLMLGTWKAIAENLCDRGMVRRYTTEIDAMPGREGAFVVCGFWEAEYLARAGRLDEACRQFECLLEYANPLGLYSEEYDVDEGKMLGNFPQAFSHTGLISAALAIESARAAARGAA
jgi:GH15 family glucan-1,4-alpha-glucosidase